jgi:hypothetical protein
MSVARPPEVREQHDELGGMDFAKLLKRAGEQGKQWKTFVLQLLAMPLPL